MSNIHSLSSVKKDTAKKANEEEYYAGGTTSGTAVWRPTDGAARQQPSDAISSILQRAQANAASSASTTPTPAASITLYANGFQIGSGDFRSASDPRNAQFLAELKRGEVPRELEAAFEKEMKVGATDEQVAVNLIDKTSETFTPPKPKFDFSKSTGQSLTSSSTTATSLAAFAGANPQRLPTVPDSEGDRVTLQFVLADRRRFKETFSGSATVLQLYGHVMSLSGLAGFELIAGFPPKPLTDPLQTLKDAKLNGAQVQQRGGA